MYKGTTLTGQDPMGIPPALERVRRLTTHQEHQMVSYVHLKQYAMRLESPSPFTKVKDQDEIQVRLTLQLSLKL